MHAGETSVVCLVGILFWKKDATLTFSLFVSRVFGLREDYAEILHLCRNCRCLFWKTYGHPCIIDHPTTDNKADEPNCDPEAYYVPVPPQAFLKFFSL